jgi:hypothetical protein
VNEREARRLLYERSNGVCEACGQARATDAHHRKNRSQGGTWDLTNLLHLCRKDHAFVTENPEAGRTLGHVVWGHEDPKEVLARHHFWGWVALEDDGGFQLTIS